MQEIATANCMSAHRAPCDLAQTPAASFLEITHGRVLTPWQTVSVLVSSCKSQDRLKRIRHEQRPQYLRASTVEQAQRLHTTGWSDP